MQTHKNNASWKIMFPLFLVIFVDVIGLCIVFPVLAPLIYDPSQSLLPASWGTPARNWAYGIMLSIWPIFMFISAPIVGDLSDKLGRKKVILICLFGEAIAYMLGAASVSLHSLSLMLISRVFAGAFSGSQPIAQAAIADISTPENKTRNMSNIVLASTLGVVLGPIIGGLSAETQFISWFNYGTPFQIAAVIALINAVLLMVAFKETHVVKQAQKIQWLKCLFLLVDAFKLKQIRAISAPFFLQMLAWALYFQALAYFLMRAFQYGSGRIGFFYGVLGMAASVTLSYLIKVLLRRCKKEITIFGLGCICTFIGAFIATCFLQESLQYVAAIFGAVGISLGYTVALSFYSNAVGEDQQGWIMGIPASLAGFAWAVTAICIGPLTNAGLTAAFAATTVIAALSILALIPLKRRILK